MLFRLVKVMVDPRGAGPLLAIRVTICPSPLSCSLISSSIRSVRSREYDCRDDGISGLLLDTCCCCYIAWPNCLAAAAATILASYCGCRTYWVSRIRDGKQLIKYGDFLLSLRAIFYDVRCWFKVVEVGRLSDEF